MFHHTKTFFRLTAFYLSSGEAGILPQAVVTSLSKSYICSVELAPNLKPGDFILVNTKTSFFFFIQK